MNQSEADVLLLLDCCHGAQAARERIKTNRVELLAACAMGLSSPPPGPDSFTTTIIKYLRTAVNGGESITISDLSRRLAPRAAGLMQTPVHVQLLESAGSGRSIRLEPLPSGFPGGTDKAQEVARKEETAAATSVLLRLSTSQKIDDNIFDQIIEWLVLLAPRAISDLKVEDVCHSTARLRGFLLRGTDQATTRSLIKLSPEAIKEAAHQCVELDSFLLGSGLPEFWGNDLKAQDQPIQEASARAFVHRLIEHEAKLKRLVERNIVASCAEEAKLGQALKDNTIQNLPGVSNTLKLRHLALYGNFDHTTMPIHTSSTNSTMNRTNGQPPSEVRQLTGGKLAYIEYKYYAEDDKDPAKMQIAARRVVQLAKLLSEARSDEFRCLKFADYFHEPERNRYAISCTVPGGDSIRIVTLQDLIQQTKTKFKPSSDEKYLMAWRLGEALRSWHLAGWVHQGIASRNILFVLPAGASKAEYGAPYLCGFEYSRLSEAPSYPRYVENLPSNVYCHPDRQDYPNEAHRKEHDLYSYGVVLLEIGLWQLAEVLFEKKTQVTAQEMKDTVISNAEIRLAQYTGKKFKNATLKCLRNEFGVIEDDRGNTRLSKAFEQLVLDRIKPDPDLD